MARITVLSVPAYGHLIPMLGTIAELVRRGHDVEVLNGAEMALLIARTGARFIAYPDVLSAGDVARTLKDGNLIAVLELILDATPALADFTLAHLTTNRPDVIVYDSIAVWGYIARRTLGLRAVSDSPIFVYEFLRHLTSWRELTSLTARFLPALPRVVASSWKLGRFGLRNLPFYSGPLVPMRGDVDIVLSSREVHPKSPLFDDPRWVFVGGTMDPGTRQDPFDYDRLDGRPLVLVSLGTVQYTNDAFFRMVMQTFADYPAQFVLAAGPGADPQRLGTPPENFIVVPTYPQLPLLERAAAFITHGGLGSIHEGLWHGVPMVGVPQHFEQLRNALAAQDGAIVLDARCHGGEVTGPQLRTALERVIADPSYRAAATRLGATLRAGGGSRAAADVIETIAAGAIHSPHVHAS